MPQCNLSQTGTHSYEPDRHVLSRVTCLNCGHSKLCTKAKCASKYLKYRRNMQDAQGLLNVVVPLDNPSAALLAEVLASCQIERGAASKNQGTVTILEGFLPQSTEAEPPLFEGLLRDLHTYPTVTFHKLHKVRHRAKDLLLADVTLHPTVASSARAAADGDNCVLPQYPAHVVLGTVCRRVSVNALKSVRYWLQGRTLTMDASRMVCVGIKDRARRRMCGNNDTIPREGQQVATQHIYQHSSDPSAEDLTADETAYQSDPDTMSSSDVEDPLSSEREEKEVGVNDVSDLLIDLTFLDNFNDNTCIGATASAARSIKYGYCGYNSKSVQFHGEAVDSAHFGTVFASGWNFGIAR